MSYTKGSWTIKTEKSGEIFIASDGEERYIAQLFYTGHPESIKEDAHLIAAAPDLLEALKLCRVRVFMADGSENEAYQKAFQAIAKAEGR